VHDWEVDLVSSFFGCCILSEEGKEERIEFCWIPSKRRKFEVKSYYHVLSNYASFLFLERVFGELRLLREWRSLRGWRH